MKIAVDKTKCIGCGTCVAIAEKSFQLDTNSKVQVINPPAGGDPEAKVKEAADACPVSAISIQ